MVSIGVVGDYQPENETLTSIADAVKHSSVALDLDTTLSWLPTDEHRDPTAFDAVWIASGSPYRDFEGAIEAIRVARTSGVPLIGTCAGFQHAVIEFARNVCGLDEAQHGEYDTDSSTLVIDELVCSLAGQTMDVNFVPGSTAGDAYGTTHATERYYCRFGLTRSTPQRSCHTDCGSAAPTPMASRASSSCRRIASSW